MFLSFVSDYIDLLVERQSRIGILFFILSLLLMWSDESANDVKSSWPLQVGLHIRYNEDIRFGASRRSYEKNVFLVQIAFCNLKCVKVDLPVIANQPSCGEQVLKSCTNRPSQSGRRLALSYPMIYACYAASSAACVGRFLTGMKS